MVSKKPKGLGLGLEALLGPKVNDTPAGGAPSELRLAQLRPGKYQPRTRMDEGSLFELAESIRSQGVIQPVLVRPVAAGSAGEGGAAQFEIIAGERRVRAAALAGLDAVPVLVKPVPDEAAAVMSLIENIQREDLNPLEEAQGLQRLVGEFKLTHEQAAQAVGRSRSAASNLMRLLHLAEPVQQHLMAGQLDMGHARALLALPAAEQVMAGEQIVARSLSVREAERLVARKLNQGPAGKRKAAKKLPGKSRDVQRIEERLADQLAAPVEIRLKRRARGGDAGEVAIRFESLEALSGLLERLGVTEG